MRDLTPFLASWTGEFAALAVLFTAMRLLRVARGLLRSLSRSPLLPRMLPLFPVRLWPWLLLPLMLRLVLSFALYCSWLLFLVNHEFLRIRSLLQPPS